MSGAGSRDWDAPAAGVMMGGQRWWLFLDGLIHIEKYREDVWNFPSRLRHQIAYLASVVASTGARPTGQSVERYTGLRAELDALVERLDRILERRIISD